MKKVLLVDNVKSIIERERSLLDRDIFNIYTATSGQEALDVHRREMVDIIIMDLHMPGMAGDEVCRAIRNDPAIKKVSILLATLLNSADEVGRCKAAGANAWLKKPINRDELSQKMSALIGVSARQAIRILVRVKVDSKVGADFFIANTVDVSATGMLFECDKELHMGEAVEASFFIPGSSGYNRVVVKGEIVREAGNYGSNKRYGVKFSEFREGNADMISEFVNKKLGKS